jgi:archaellum biogenesis protein FlaJ (TadC family)
MKDFFFDYIYYRVTKAYFRWDGENSITAAISISMIQSLLPLECLILVMYIISDRDPNKPLYPKAFNYVWVAVMVALMIYNFRKHNNKYDSYKAKWKDEPRKQRVIKGFLVLFFMILPWAIGILEGIYMKY